MIVENLQEMVRDSDATLGRAMWHMLHTIAVNFPDNGKGLTEDRLRAYFDFFDSLKYVLPRKTWQDSWRMVTSVGKGALTWKKFQTVRSHQDLSTWLFYVHDQVRKTLRQPTQGPSEPAVRYKQFYQKYAKYRIGNGKHANSGSNYNTNAGGTARIKAILARHISAMDTFMAHKYPDYSTWSRLDKYESRKKHLDEAARWYWTNTRNALSKNASWNRKNAAAQREEIVSQFQRKHRRLRNTIGSKILAIPTFGREILGM